MFDDRPADQGGRNPWLLLGGLLLLALAAAFLLFGNSLFARPQRPPGLADSVPALDGAAAEPIDLADLASAEGPQAGDALAVGDVPPDFTLVNLDGDPVHLADTQGQIVLLNFWATWCPPCRVEMPDLQAAHERYAEDGLVILALDQDEPPDRVAGFFLEMGFTFTPLLDVHSLVADLYGVYSYPTSIFLDRDGRITTIHRGLMTGDQLEGYLAPLLAAAP